MYFDRFLISLRSIRNDGCFERRGERGIGGFAADSPFFPLRGKSSFRTQRSGEEPPVKFILMICRKSRTRQGSDVGRKTMPPFKNFAVYGTPTIYVIDGKGVITGRYAQLEEFLGEK